MLNIKNKAEKEKLLPKEEKSNLLYLKVLFVFLGFYLLVMTAHELEADGIGEFFSYPVSARVMSLGNIGESLPLNPAGVFGNPASIAGISGLEYSEMFVPSDMANTYIHSASIMYSKGKVTQFLGARVGFSVANEKDKYFEFNVPKHHYRMGVFGLAFSLTPHSVIGFSGNIYQNNLEDNSNTSIGVNIGSQIRLRMLTLSAAAKNIGVKNGNDENLNAFEAPCSYNTGVYLSLLDGIIGTGGQISLDDDGRVSSYSFGSEFTFGRFLSFRAGYETSDLNLSRDIIQDELYAVGFGIRLETIVLDYAVKLNHQNKNDYIHFITFGINGAAADK